MIVEYHPEALAELSAATAYYDAKKVGLGTEFLDVIIRATNAIAGAPERWATSRRGHRCYLLDRFPFSIFYEVQNDIVFILAIAHHSRKPNYWRSRPNN